ncbi:CTP synthase C-terminal region-related (seleno)protein [Streptomyces erythrochromogenes]|uniref:CTP synthase C-terminal region-related (seleno)protein n=1 Tax=Streptomyces erythrochromogenes TaxID=285574 RepID=UPI0036AD278D
MTTAHAAAPADAAPSASAARTQVARIALVGDRSPHVKSHARIPLLLDALASRDGLVLDAYWIPTSDAAAEAAAGTLARFDAVWVLPGSPYASEAGALAAIRVAREEGIPFLGTCGGFQHTLLEYARTVCGLAGVAHAENDPGAPDLLIAPLACSLVGHEGVVRAEPGSLAETALGAERSTEHYHCTYGPAPRHLPALTAHGLRLSGHDEEGQVRIAELPGHPFFLATLFQPELQGDGTRPHPIVRALAVAAVAHAAARAAGVAAE